MPNAVEMLKHQGSGLRAAIQQTVARPLTALLTVFSIALALTLPGLLLSTLEQLKSSNISLEGERKINLFLNLDTPPESSMGLVNELTSDQRVESIQQIDPGEALQTLRDKSELGETLDLLTDNPLPITLVITASPQMGTDTIHVFAEELRGLPEVNQARVDSEYLQRLGQLGSFLRTLVVVVVILFLALICLVLMNNARLEMLRRREEIEVTKLVEGTDGYIIRPFVYQAFMLCCAGTLLALLIIAMIFSAISPALSDLTSGYQSTIDLKIGNYTRLYLPLAAVFFAVTATWITIKTTLKKINPQ